MQTIYCVEDESNIRDLVLYALRASGFIAEGFDCATAFYERMQEQCPDLVMLDIMLVGEDGLSILRKLRNDPTTSRLPVIMLTAKTTEYDRVTGLDGGADDYLSKPFGVLELISRVKAVLRRVAPPTSDDHKVGRISMSAERHTVQVDGTAVSLTFKEFELLRFLMQNVGLVFSRERLMEAVWGFGYEGESRTVDMHVKTLRQKLGDAGAQIGTVRGVGYKIEEFV